MLSSQSKSRLLKTVYIYSLLKAIQVFLKEFELKINSSEKSFGFSSEVGKIRPSKSGDIKGTAR
jgi:hypothetical protein